MVTLTPFICVRILSKRHCCTKKKVSFCFPGMQPAYYRQACFAKIKSVTEHQFLVFEIFHIKKKKEAEK